MTDEQTMMGKQRKAGYLPARQEKENEECDKRKSGRKDRHDGEGYRATWTATTRTVVVLPCFLSCSTRLLKY